LVEVDTNKGVQVDYLNNKRSVTRINVRFKSLKHPTQHPLICKSAFNNFARKDPYLTGILKNSNSPCRSTKTFAKKMGKNTKRCHNKKPKKGAPEKEVPNHPSVQLSMAAMTPSDPATDANSVDCSNPSSCDPTTSDNAHQSSLMALMFAETPDKKDDQGGSADPAHHAGCSTKQEGLSLLKSQPASEQDGDDDLDDWEEIDLNDDTDQDSESEWEVVSEDEDWELL
jgi:hypothetical protein